MGYFLSATIAFPIAFVCLAQGARADVVGGDALRGMYFAKPCEAVLNQPGLYAAAKARAIDKLMKQSGASQDQANQIVAMEENVINGRARHPTVRTCQTEMGSLIPPIKLGTE